jgi:hypothetical protein
MMRVRGVRVAIGSLVAIIFVLLLFLGHGRFSPQKRSTAKIIATLDSCPAWTDLEEDDYSGREQLLSAMNQLRSDYDLPSLREAIRAYVAMKGPEDDLQAFSRLFILNRCLFDVPSSCPTETPIFGSWRGRPYEGATVNLLWPLSLDKEGGLHLTGKYHGYFGGPYDPLAEFDFFQDHYPVRKKLNSVAGKDKDGKEK